MILHKKAQAVLTSGKEPFIVIGAVSLGLLITSFILISISYCSRAISPEIYERAVIIFDQQNTIYSTYKDRLETKIIRPSDRE